MKKNSKSGLASNVTTTIKEITALLYEDLNLQTVKEKLMHVIIAFENFKEAHFEYYSEVEDQGGIAECQNCLSKQKDNFGAFRGQVNNWIVAAKYRRLSAELHADFKIKPEDSVSSVGSQARSDASKHWKRSILAVRVLVESEPLPSKQRE